LRGLVIVIMALDHVRDFFHITAHTFNPLDPAHTNPVLYATRWITHLCAPTFVLLAGVSAYLQFVKGKDTPTLSRFLLTRGLWLIFLEMTIISLGWSFWIPWALFLQVFWAIGWSMTALAALVWLPRRAVLGVGLAIVFGHNLLDPIKADQLGSWAPLWRFLHERGPIMMDGTQIGVFAYPVLPWIGIMAFGYGLGAVFLAPAKQRDRTLLVLGVSMLAGFLALRLFNHYGDPHGWTAQGDLTATAMSFLDAQKYPPSLDFALATLGIVFCLTPALGRLNGAASRFLTTFGAVPLFAYVVHLYIAHALTILVHIAMGRNPSGYLNMLTNVFVDPARLQGLGFSLWAVYLFWAVVLAMLYPLCRWWVNVKRTRSDWWLSYL
jgi:uncharacterized membrane protein